MPKERVYPIGNSNWSVLHEDADEISGFRAEMPDRKVYWVEAINATGTNPDGSEKKYVTVIVFEQDNGGDRAGDIVLTFRVGEDGRYTVQTDEEVVHLTPKEFKKIMRATRSSVDNPKQSVKRRVVKAGEIYLNARRIGGKPVFTHYVLAGPATQAIPGVEQTDVFDYVRSQDGPGKAAFLDAIVHMSDKPARAIFRQMRDPMVDRKVRPIEDIAA